MVVINTVGHLIRGTELLGDYHYYVTGQYHHMVGRVLVCDCVECRDWEFWKSNHTQS